MKRLEEYNSEALARQAERRVQRAIAHNPVLVAAAVAALVTMFIVPPSSMYLYYFDWHTLICLFCILSVLAAIESCGLLDFIAHSIVEHVSSTRTLVIALVLVTFVLSLILSNDMTLVTILPLTLILLKSVHRERTVPFAFIMITLAANLGGMLFPFGNPHNLYLYSVFDVDFGVFVSTMAPPLILSLVLMLACCIFVRKEEFHYSKPETIKLSKNRMIMCLVLFGICVAMTINAIPYVIGAVVVIAVLALTDHQAFAKTDYSLILTFICFFVFSGNISHIPAVAAFFSGFLSDGAFLTTLVSSQVISNLPSAILMSHFSSDWAGIALGANIGGIGTPISSLATLITIRQFQTSECGKMSRFMLHFEGYNFAFLVVLAAFEMLVMGVA